MKSKSKIYGLLPEIIKNTLSQADTAFLVGGAVQDMLNGKSPRDWDIVVEDITDYYRLVKYLEAVSEHYGINTFGGFKFNLDVGEIDVWSMNLGKFFINSTSPGIVYNLKRQITLKITG